MVASRKKLPILVLACVLACSMVWGMLAGLGGLRAALARPLFATYPVTNTNDSGGGSLRQAILDANAATGADLIQITATGTIVLLSPLPVISEAVTIQGTGANLLAVDGAGSFRVFEITAAGVTLADLTVQNGSALGASPTGAGIRATSGLNMSSIHVLSNTSQNQGGGVYVTGNLVITASLFQNNHSVTGGGGGLYNSGTATLTNTEFISNTAYNDGGALITLGELFISGGLFQDNHCTAFGCDGGGLFSFSRTTLTGTQFLGNSAQDEGGGASAPGVLTVTNGLFQGNQAVQGQGGGLFAQFAATVEGTQFLSNTARSVGGGIYSLGALTVTHGLFANNQGLISSGGGLNAFGALLISDTLFLRNTAVEGGGFAHGYGDGRVVNSLFAGNEATGQVGEAFLLASPDRVDVLHTTIAGPGVPGGSAVEVLTGTIGITNTLITSHTVGISNTGGVVAQDYNLFFGVGTNTLGVVAGGAHSHVGDPLFAAPGLDDYHLSPGSAAIDAGIGAGVTVDFEGEARPQNYGYDIGFDEIEVPPDLLGYYMYLPAIRK